jgi:hypothetical protein
LSTWKNKMFGRSAIAISPSCTWHAACQIVPPSARPRTKVITHTPRTPGRGQTGGREPDRRWPDFGLTVTPNADNCCTLLRNVMASQRQNWLVKRTRVDPYGTEGTPCEAESRRGWRGHRRAGRRGRCGASRCRLARGDPATTSSRTLIFTVHFSPFEALHLNPNPDRRRGSGSATAGLHDLLFSHGTRAGDEGGSCVVVDASQPLANCTQVTRLNQGTITAEGLAGPPPRKHLALTGGTGIRFGCQHQDYRTADKIVDYWLRAHLPVDMGGGGRHARGVTMRIADIRRARRCGDLRSPAQRR